EQRLIGNGSLVALDRLEDGAADEPDLRVQRLRHPLLDFGEAIERAVLEARRVETLTSGLSGKSTADLLSAGGGVGSRGLYSSVGLARHGLHRARWVLRIMGALRDEPAGFRQLPL